MSTDAFDDDIKKAKELAEIKIETEKKLSEVIKSRQKWEKDYNDKLVKQRRAMELVTRSMSIGGGVMGAGFGLLQNIASSKYMGYKRLQELNAKSKTEILSPEEGKERMFLSGGKSNNLFEKLDSVFEKHFGGDSKWNKFFAGQGKMAALGIGAGAIGGGMALGKMIIDSSPMMQQMMKLWKFGIMMILRPIGDFFGFLFRPILLILLRKFIIPNYQKWMPMMMRWGTAIGEALAAILDGTWATKIDWAGLIKTSLGVSDSKTAFENFTSGLTTIATILAPTGILILALKAFESIMGKIFEKAKSLIPDLDGGGGNKPNVGAGSGHFTGKGVSTGKGQTVSIGGKTPVEFTDEPKGTRTLSTGKYSKNPVIKDLQKFMERIEETAGRRGKDVTWKAQQVSNYLKTSKLGSTLKKLGKNAIRDSPLVFFPDIGNIPNPFRLFGDALFEEFWNLFTGQVSKSTPRGVAMANGGIINEPITGIGRSGQMYMFGERGSEKVTPLNKGASSSNIPNITINIQNMSGDQQDLNNLRKTILNVIQSVNVNRGR